MRGNVAKPGSGRRILLAGLTITFLLAVVSVQSIAIHSVAPKTVFVLTSMLVCLILT